MLLKFHTNDAEKHARTFTEGGRRAFCVVLPTSYSTSRSPIPLFCYIPSKRYYNARVTPVAAHRRRAPHAAPVTMRFRHFYTFVCCRTGYALRFCAYARFLCAGARVTATAFMDFIALLDRLPLPFIPGSTVPSHYSVLPVSWYLYLPLHSMLPHPRNVVTRHDGHCRKVQRFTRFADGQRVRY